MLPGLEYLTFNRSEHIALRSGAGTATYLQSLRQHFPNHTISVCSHSRGLTVITEALRQLAAAGQAPIDNYVAMQGAFPAHAFDTAVTNLPMSMQVEKLVPTPNTYHNYAAGIGNALRGDGRFINFFSPVDFASALESQELFGGAWELNQVFYADNQGTNGSLTMKPNTYFGYYTDGTNSTLRPTFWNQLPNAIIYGGYYPNGPTRAVTNVHELMPFVARARTKALGSQPGVGGEVSQSDEINLSTQFGFTGRRIDHSGQFRRSIQYSGIWPFYTQLEAAIFAR